MGGGGRGGGGGGLNVFCDCVELGYWASEKLSGRVQLEGHSPKWRALQNFSFQPCSHPPLFTTSFFSLDLLGNLSSTEPVGLECDGSSRLGAWRGGSWGCGFGQASRVIWHLGGVIVIAAPKAGPLGT